MTLTVSFWLALSAATLSAGESSMLLIGMRGSAGPDPWMTGVNIAYAASDIALGLGLGALELAGQGDSWYTKAALGAIILSCGVRLVEYATGAPHPFCANAPLLAVDIGKMALAGAAILAMSFGR